MFPLKHSCLHSAPFVCACSVQCQPVKCNIAHIKLHSESQVSKRILINFLLRYKAEYRTRSSLVLISTISPAHRLLSLRRRAGSCRIWTKWSWAVPQATSTPKLQQLSLARRSTVSKHSIRTNFHVPLSVAVSKP